MLLVGSLLALGLAGVELARFSLGGFTDLIRAGGLADPAAVDPLVATAASGAAASLCGWLLLGVLLTCIEVGTEIDPAPTGRAGLMAARLARRTAPAVLRHGVAALLGVTLGVATLSATLPATANTTAAGSSVGPPADLHARSVTAQAGTGLVGTGLVGTGLVGTGPVGLAPGWLGAAPAGSEAAPVLVDTSPGWTPNRPQARHVAPRTAAPSGQARRPQARAQLGDEVVVRKGDTLWALAARQLGRDASDAQIALEWPTWFDANRQVIGEDPDVLLPGVRLRVPEQGGAR